MEKIAVSVHVSFQYSSWILPEIYFSTYGIVSRLCIQYAQLTLELYLYRALVTAVVQQAQQTAVLHELFCKSFKNFHHFEGFSYTTKYLLQNHFYIALNSFEVQIHLNYHFCWLEWRKFKKTNQEGQRPGTRSVCHLPKRQGGLNVTVNEFALMNDLVTHYQLLNFVNLWVTEQNKKDSTSQECSCFIVLVTFAVS